MKVTLKHKKLLSKTPKGEWVKATSSKLPRAILTKLELAQKIERSDDGKAFKVL